jgi:hypothetical protein
MATDELAAAGADSVCFSFGIWAPTHSTQGMVVQHLVETLAMDAILCKHYNTVLATEAESYTSRLQPAGPG